MESWHMYLIKHHKHHTFLNRSGLGICNRCLLASCSSVTSMFFSFRSTYLRYNERIKQAKLVCVYRKTYKAQKLTQPRQHSPEFVQIFVALSS